jgi:hypothetical protein
LGLNITYIQSWYLDAQAAVKSVIAQRASPFDPPVILYQSAFQTDQGMWAAWFAEHNILSPLLDLHTYHVRQWTSQLAGVSNADMVRALPFQPS